VAPSTHRLFFALVPDEATRLKIETLHRRLGSEHGFSGRAVKPGLYHVTLAFLGNQPAERLPQLLALGASLDMPAGRVACDRLGRFRRAGIVWFGTSNPPPELRAFQVRLCTALEQAQITFDRKPWKFHLTLYRDLRTPYVRIDPGTVIWNLDGFLLMESVNTGKGVAYHALGSWKARPAGGAQNDVKVDL